MFEEAYPLALSLYRYSRQKLKKQVYHSYPFQHLFRGPTEVKKFNKCPKKIQDTYFLNNRSWDVPEIKAEFGGVSQSDSGFLNTPLFLSEWRQYFDAKKRLSEEECSEKDLICTKDHIEWKGIRAKAVFLATGTDLLKSNWINKTDFRTVKGDILTIENPIKTTDAIWFKGTWICPNPNQENTCKAGATFIEDYSTTYPQPDDKTVLLNKLSGWIKSPIKVLLHQSGERVMRHDKRPFLKRLSSTYPIWGLGALGSKGILLSPYLAKKLIRESLHDRR